MTRIIRIDDFPHGDKKIFNHRFYKKQTKKILSIFEEFKVPYILGASPLIMKDDDVDFLNSVVKHGYVCMHGFTHGWDLSPWESITQTWKYGGEFFNMNENEINKKYDQCNNILKNIKKYTYEHFIPPFNSFNQELLNVLATKSIKYIHTCSKEYNEFNQHNLDYHQIEPIISIWQKTYADIDVVLKNINNKSQITLHWVYDIRKANCIKYYVELCKKLTSDSC